MKKIALILSILFTMINLAVAGNKELDRKQIYELRRECKEDADRYVNKYSDVRLDKVHYNIKLNKCLAEILIKDKDDPEKFISRCLVDVNESNILERCEITTYAEFEKDKKEFFEASDLSILNSIQFEWNFDWGSEKALSSKQLKNLQSELPEVQAAVLDEYLPDLKNETVVIQNVVRKHYGLSLISNETNTSNQELISNETDSLKVDTDILNSLSNSQKYGHLRPQIEELRAKNYSDTDILNSLISSSKYSTLKPQVEQLRREINEGKAPSQPGFISGVLEMYQIPSLKEALSHWIEEQLQGNTSTQVLNSIITTSKHADLIKKIKEQRMKDLADFNATYSYYCNYGLKDFWPKENKLMNE